MDRIPVSGIRAAGDVRPVSLVGAGPGDPGLMTVKGARRLHDADVVFHDALVSGEILSLCRRRTRLVDVGRRRGFAPVPFERVVETMAQEARAGRWVVRLKGGDPFVFGRGSEEALALLRAGVPCEVVPGVCSGTALPALAGIPLTHRGLAGSAAFVTAHDLSPGPAGARVRRRLLHLARGAETLVVFMARGELDRLGRTLVRAGLHGATPAAIVLDGSTPREQVVECTLAELGPGLLDRDAGRSPAGRHAAALLVVGQAVSLRAEILRARDPGASSPRERNCGTILGGDAAVPAARRRAV